MKINYFTFGTNDMDKAASFYDALFDGTELSRAHTGDRMILWSNDTFMFAIAKPFDGQNATNGNGSMLGLNLDSIEDVDQMHRKALELGGKCEGEPHVRSGRHSAYFRDLDNNKWCIYV
jgi:predicted lactoylglutathione lyase